MPSLSTIVAEHPDLLTTIVCALARDVGGGDKKNMTTWVEAASNILPLASVCRWSRAAFAPSSEIWRTLCVTAWPSTAALSLGDLDGVSWRD